MDAGTYPVSLILMAARERPARVSAVAHWRDGVDHALAATLEFNSGLLAQVTSSFATSLHRFALIAGTQGVIQTQFLNHPPLNRPAEFLIERGVGADRDFEKIATPALNGFRAEAESFAQLVRGTAQWQGPTPEESIDIARTLEAMLQSARTNRPVDI
jgi:predicted dehydrogenase